MAVATKTKKTASKAATDDGAVAVKITPLRENIIGFRIRGVSPYVQHRFSQKTKEDMEKRQKAGSTARSKKTREARDFQADFEAATYRGPNGEYGIPAAAFRNAMIAACRSVGFNMTLAKQAIFVEPDFFDPQEGYALIELNGAPTMHVGPARNSNTSVDLRARPMWQKWEALVRVRVDLDVFTIEDVTNLMVRAGRQVGVGEGRHASRISNGLGWGCFEIEFDSRG